MPTMTDTTLATARPRIFYGWVVVAGAFVVMFVGFGVSYSFSSFFDALESEFGANRSDVSLVFAITSFLYFAVGAASGPVADRVGPRRVVLAGIALIVAGLTLASRANALWQVYVTYSVGVGVGVGFAYVPAIGAVQRWFVVRRGSASGMAVTGIGVGTLAMPLLAAWLIDMQGWRGAYVSLAALSLLAGIPAALLIEHSPQRRNLHPDGAAGSAASAQPAYGMAVRAALRSRPFWLLYGAGLASGLGLFIPFVHLVPYATDHGLSHATGALLVGLIGLGSSAGRLAMGPSSDRLGRQPSLAVSFAAMAATLFFWLVATQFWTLAIFAVLFGAAYGGYVALMPALASDFFGAKNAGGILGVMYTSAGLGALVGPTIAGLAYDLNDSYVLPIVFGGAVNVVAVVCVLALGSSRPTIIDAQLVE